MKKVSNNIYSFSKNNNNAYLINGDIKVLIDGVEEKYSDEYINSIERIVPIKEITYIIINHCEKNRCGTLSKVLEINPDIKVVASTAGLKFLQSIIQKPFNEVLAKDNQELNIGGEDKVKFLLTPYINWPDSMVTIYKDNLFSCDLFGDENNSKEEYYDRNLSYYPDNVDAAIDRINDLKINMVYSGSGTIKKYSDLPSFMKVNKEENILIIYSSIYGTTKTMAEKVYNTLIEIGKNTEIYNACDIDSAELSYKINNCTALALGINTVNADAMPQIWDIIARTKKIINKRKKCMLFGSYGWGGEGLYYVEQHMKLLKYNIFDKPFGVIFKLNDDTEKKFVEYTKKFAEFVELNAQK